MKKLFIIILIICSSNFISAQKLDGYNYEYSVNFQTSQLIGRDVKDVARGMRDHIFTLRGQKFNIQTRYDQKGRIEIYTELRILQSDIESYFEILHADMFGFTEKPVGSSVLLVNDTSMK